MIGIDKQIAEAVGYLQSIFPNMKIYGRVHRTTKRDRIIPELYENGEYKETLTDDAYSNGVLFFDVEPRRRVNAGEVTATVNIIVIAKLDIAYDTENIHATIGQELEKADFTIDELITGTEALQPFQVNAPDDMQPYHIFRFTAETKYSLNCNT